MPQRCTVANEFEICLKRRRDMDREQFLNPDEDVSSIGRWNGAFANECVYMLREHCIF